MSAGPGAAMSAQSAAGAPGRRNGARTALLLGAVPLVMFGVGFALAPVYSMLCEAIGIQTASAAVARAQAVPAAAVARPVTVRFDTNVPADLPWEFTASSARAEVRTGIANEMTFRVRNRSAEPLVGRAIPTVVPWQAARHFIKTECFCFQDQALAPGESRELTVRFLVSPQLPDDIDALTLSYTFLRHATNLGTAQAASTNNSKG